MKAEYEKNIKNYKEASGKIPPKCQYGHIKEVIDTIKTLDEIFKIKKSRKGRKNK